MRVTDTLFALIQLPPWERIYDARNGATHDPVADVTSEEHYPFMMRITWLVFALISLVAATIIWAFAAGWAGKIVFLPDLALLRSGEWFSWVFVVALMYGPLAFAGLMIAKAIRSDI